VVDHVYSLWIWKRKQPASVFLTWM
jgi:hypothetical protein